MRRIAEFFVYNKRLAWVSMIALSLLAGSLVTFTDIYQRENQRLSILQFEARRSSLEITSSTLNGNIMGSVTLLGVINRDIKQDATNGLMSIDANIHATLAMLGNAFQAEGAFLVGEDGIVKSSWDRSGKPSTGLDVRFRPYYQKAMKGQSSVYAAVSMARGERALYFSAPVFAEGAGGSTGIGAVVARTNLDRVDALLKGKFDQALLLSPQGVVFASTKPQWVGMLEGQATPERLKSIRELRQFGPLFDKSDPAALPLSAVTGMQLLEGRRFAVSTAPVPWNDPSGDWSLVVLEDLDKSVPKTQPVLQGTGTAIVGLLFGLMWIHLLRGRREQIDANTQVQQYAQLQEATAAFRSRLATTSNRLQRSETLESLAQVFLQEARQLLGVVHGAVYMVPAQGPLCLQLIGASASAEPPPAQLELGEGLLGQCAKEQRTQLILTPPEGIWSIRSGLGYVQPAALLLAPMVLHETLIGVVELAFLQVPPDDARHKLEEIVSLLTNSMEILRRSRRTVELLEAAEQQGQAMQVQAQELGEQKTVIEATEAWYRSIIESAPDGMLVTNEQGVITLANFKLEALFGYAPGELVGNPIEILVPQAIRPQHVGLRDGYAGHGENRTMGSLNKELQGVRKDGSAFPVEVVLSRLQAIAGRGANVCASVRDITERKAVAKEMQDAKQSLEIALTSAKMGSWKFYPTEGRLQADAATIRLYGLEGVEMDGTLGQWFTFVDPQDAQNLGALMQHTMANQLAEYRTHFRVVKPNHDTAYIMSIGRFTYDDAGQAVLATGLVWDITDIKVAQEKLRLANASTSSQALEH